ncbi:hypothetical protein GOV10_02340, partial [Candidatus Woesearchaeota archaeon]|nr:hypothetical protein [Candidatus Woesearchaeota archaeon]
CPTNTTICSEQELSLPFSQYVMLMLQRQQAPGELDPIPVVNTFTFGKSLESVATQAQFQAETITQLRNDGLLTDEQFTLVTQELQRDTTIAFELEKYRTIKMIPGTYDIQAFLFYTGNIQIPAERRKEGNILSSTTINLPAMNFTTWLQGGVEFRGDKGLIFTPEQIYGPDPLVIYVLEQPLPLSWKMMEEYRDTVEYQEQFANLAQPEFETLPDPLN